MKPLMRLYPFAVAAIALTAISFAEPLYFPVVRDWTVSSMTHVGNSVTMTGYVRKVRECRLIGVLATDDDGREMWVSLQDNAADQTLPRPKDSQAWGPWRISMVVPEQTGNVRFQAVHQCHSGWPTKTELDTINLYPGLNR